MKNKVILLDAGIKKVYHKYYGEPPYLELAPLNKLVAAAITHLHEDHIAMLPRLVRLGVEVPMYMTQPTLELGKRYLYRWAKQFEEDGRKLYGAEDVDKTLKNVRIVKPGDIIDVDGFRLRFYRAGHAVGAVSILIEVGDKRILYLGDVDTDSYTIKGLDLELEEPVDIVIINASYGARAVDRDAQGEALVYKVYTRLRR